ncbi:MAG TPA: ABC transporter permease [Chitinophagales bacterium]|nr:ABC transporter permease [Chitinophagales bacterium]
MSKIPIIIKREYMTRVRSRVFIIVTFLLPLIMGIVPMSIIYMVEHGADEQTIAVLDHSKLFVGKLEDEDQVKFGFFDASFDSMKKHYAEKGCSGILYIPDTFNLDHPSGIEYFSNDELGLGTTDIITNQITKVVTKVRLEKVNVTPEMIDKLEEPVQFKTIIGTQQSNVGLAAGVGYFGGILLYMLLLIYGTQVMRGVMEEKSSRIAEVIISSVKPFELMMGKIIGIALLGLTQFIVWIIMAVAAISILHGLVDAKSLHDLQSMQSMNGNPMQQRMADAMNNVDTVLNTLPIGLIIFGTIFFFLGGYFLYASLFASIGAATGDDGDQSLTFIATLPIIVSFFLSINAMNEPNGKLAIITSMIPFCSPIVMTARLPYRPPMLQVLLSMAILIISFLILTWIAGKIYRTGILMYGKKNSLREMIKWVRY